MNMTKIKGFLYKGTWVFILLFVLYIIQHLVNFLTNDYHGPSGYLVKCISYFGIEEAITRFFLWYIYQITITFICYKLFF